MSHATDWRLAFRLFLKQPGLTAAAVVALALGVGVTTLLFSIGYGIFLRGLPFPDSDRIMSVTLSNVATGRQRLGVSLHDFADWKSGQRAFDDLAAFQMASLNVVAEGRDPKRLVGAFMTGNGFAVLGARPLLGRTLIPDDALPGAAPVLVLGYGAWMTQFGGDPGIVGRAVRADGQAATVVGVMPQGFGFPSVQEAWMAQRIDPLPARRGDGPALIAYGRLKRDVDGRQAQADLGAISSRLATTYPETNRNIVPVVQPYTELMGGNESGTMAMLLTVGMGFCVLLIACANVANLLFARAASRTREVAIRTAIGAGRRRIVRQLLTEVVVLAIAGTGVGLLIAWAGIAAFNQAMVDANPPFWIVVRLDVSALLFAMALTGIAALLSGVVPAWRASRPNLSEVLKDGARSSGGLRVGWISRSLVTVEIVLSFGLLVTAGLMIRSIINLQTHDYGFAAEDVFTARIVVPEHSYPDVGSRATFVRSLQDRLSAIPGVRAATLGSVLPGLAADTTTAVVEGDTYSDASHYPVARVAAIAPGFFETFGVTLVGGRAFGASDEMNAAPVAIVNASFVERHYRGRDPVGTRVRLGRDGKAGWLTIVGVAPDLYMSGAENREPAGIYVPLAQSKTRSVGLALRVAGRTTVAATVRSLVKALDPDLPVYSEKTLKKAIDDSMWHYVLFGPLLVVVGCAALFLSTVGLYSLMAFAARQRLREIGLRMALGARAADVARLVTGEVVGQIGLGLLVGAGLGALLSNALRTMVFHVAPHDPVIYASIAGVLVAAAALAAFVPVRRAIRVDPAITLRDQ
jgi:putative ABC transport system permease protein